MSIPISRNRKISLKAMLFASSDVTRRSNSLFSAPACRFAGPNQILTGLFYKPGLKLMTSEQSKPRSKTDTDVHVEQGLRLTNVFLKLQDVNDRQKVIAFAERLLEERNKIRQAHDPSA